MGPTSQAKVVRRFSKGPIKHETRSVISCTIIGYFEIIFISKCQRRPTSHLNHTPHFDNKIRGRPFNFTSKIMGFPPHTPIYTSFHVQTLLECDGRFNFFHWYPTLLTFYLFNKVENYLTMVILAVSSKFIKFKLIKINVVPSVNLYLLYVKYVLTKFYKTKRENRIFYLIKKKVTCLKVKFEPRVNIRGNFYFESFNFISGILQRS